MKASRPPAHPSSHCTTRPKVSPHTWILPKTKRNGVTVEWGPMLLVPLPQSQVGLFSLAASPWTWSREESSLISENHFLETDWEATLERQASRIPSCSQALISQSSASTRERLLPSSPLLGKKRADTAEIWVSWLIPEATNFSPEGNGIGGFLFSFVNNPTWDHR